METLEAVHRRLKTAGELGGLVRTMKTLAAVNIRHYQQVLLAVKQYRRTVELGLGMALTRDPSLLVALEAGAGGPDAQAAPGREPVVVLIGADRGMCGPFNERVVAEAGAALADTAGRMPRVLAVGHRLERPCELAGIAISARAPLPSWPRGITSTAEAVIVQYDSWRGTGASGELLVVHNRPLEATGYVAHTARLLPVNTRWLRLISRQPWPTRSIPMSVSPGPELLTALIRQHLLLSLHQALAESLASEHAARLVAMQVAERNVADHQSRLAGEFHRRRQQVVDEELLDLISGYLALTESALGMSLPQR
jgi:F-type H+-transporting ATPase subunit gamma